MGTTYSAVAYLKDGIPTIIPIPDNGRTMPSLVAMTTTNSKGGGSDDDDDVERHVSFIVGRDALNHQQQQQQHSAPPYSNVKRVIGTGGKLSSEIQQVVPYLIPNPLGKTYKKDNLENQLHDAQHYPTLLRRIIAPVNHHNDNDDPMSNQPNNNNNNVVATITPQEISAQIIVKLRQAAEAHTGCRVTRAVVGVPAYFNDAQREATIQAAQAAGIDKVKLLREPEAAALAYGIGKEQVGLGQEDELVLAFDLGGGTFDCSMLVVGGGVSEIICTSGNAKLGGADFDARIAQHIQSILMADGVASAKQFSANAQTAILQSAEQIRIYLTNNRKAKLSLPKNDEEWVSMASASDVIVLEEEGKTPIHSLSSSQQQYVQCEITRREMERLCKDELQALLRPVREVAIMSGALLPGDTSPTLVEAALEMEELSKGDEAMSFGDFYSEKGEGTNGKDDIDSDTLLQLQEAAMKEAKKAQQKGRRRARDLSKDERKFRQQKRKVAETSQVTSVDGIKVQDGITGRPISRIVLVGGATRMPAVGRLIGALTGVVPQKTINPDEAVALGCAANVGILDGVDGMGKVLSPMQAAILRAMAEQQEMFGEEFGEEEFDEVEYF